MKVKMILPELQEAGAFALHGWMEEIRTFLELHDTIWKSQPHVARLGSPAVQHQEQETSKPIGILSHCKYVIDDGESGIMMRPTCQQ